MRLLSVPMAVALVLLMVFPAAAAKSAFAGEWIGNDPAPPDGDGSTVHLYITGGHSNAAIMFTDEFGSVCEHVDSPVTLFESNLTGDVIDSSLVATFQSAHCGPVLVKFLKGESAVYELDDQGNSDPSDDTLFDGLVVWHRA